MDSGVRLDSTFTFIDHPDLYDPNRIIIGVNEAYSKDMNNWFNQKKNNVNDDFWHGTMITGIIGAIQNNKIGISGLCPNCKIIIYKVGIKIMDHGNERYKPRLDYTASAIEDIVKFSNENNVNAVINFSSESQDTNDYSKVLRRAIEKADSSSKIIIVCAAGNEKSLVGLPAKLSKDHNFIISVGASDYKDSIWHYSNYARDTLKEITLIAPGLDIMSTWNKSCSPYKEYYHDEGTSYATPLVTATIALIWNLNPNLKPFEVKKIIENSCTKTSGMCGKNWTYLFGYGLLNVKAAIDSTLKTLEK